MDSVLRAVKVSIIIPAYNAAATLDKCLCACEQQTLKPVEIIVVDDGSADDTARIAEQYPVRYVHQENAGPAAARNRGAAEATGDIIAYTDSDCVPEANWLEDLVAGFSDDAVVAVGGTYGIVNPESFLARIIHEEILFRHARLEDEVDFLGSFNVAYRKDAFEAVGGFDKDYTMASGEDNDLAYVLADQGGVLRFRPSAVVNHFHPIDIHKYLPTQCWHGFWRVKLYAKHPGRARGDRYAGPADLYAVPVAMILLLVCLLAPIAGLPTGTLFYWILGVELLALLLLGMHLPTTVRLVRRSGDWSMLAYLILACLRDWARGVGMLHGMLVFMIMKRTTL